jgi:hypothetical protein
MSVHEHTHNMTSASHTHLDDESEIAVSVNIGDAHWVPLKQRNLCSASQIEARHNKGDENDNVKHNQRTPVGIAATSHKHLSTACALCAQEQQDSSALANVEATAIATCAYTPI